MAAVRSALDVGYRLLDTAVNYENEAEVGRVAVRESAVPTPKSSSRPRSPGRFHARDLAIRSVEDSLRRMHLDVLDLVLVHWPNPSQGRYVEVVEALLTCRERGLVAVGVSNYTRRLLDEVIEATGFTPSVNQVELHPSFPQAELVARHESLGIRTQAWSPLARMESEGDGDDPLTRIAAARGNFAGTGGAGVACGPRDPLPKSADPARQVANLAALEITLTPDEVAAVTALGRPDGRLFDGDPETHEED